MSKDLNAKLAELDAAEDDVVKLLDIVKEVVSVLSNAPFETPERLEDLVSMYASTADQLHHRLMNNTDALLSDPPQKMPQHSNISTSSALQLFQDEK